MAATILVRGGGDLASGVILRLVRAGLNIIVTELEKPLAVRRLVAYCEAVYRGEISVEGVTARLAADPSQAEEFLKAGVIPVLIDPAAECRSYFQPLAIIDGRMIKQPPDLDLTAADLVIGLGPGFMTGMDCHAVIETKRGPFMGRVIWDGSAEPDTGMPETVASRTEDRVLRAANPGIFQGQVQLGDLLQEGQLIGTIDSIPVRARFRGVVRGLIQSGLEVNPGLKIGDIDPRPDPRIASLVSDKALAVGGGVLEALLTRPEIRNRLWQ
jgi:xanthine dehydrogenase accessory factor